MKRLMLAFVCGFIVSALTQCKTSRPPAIEMCITKIAGGADCTEADGSHVFKLPSQMDNYWCTNEPDQAKWASWCYEAELPVVQKGMQQIKSNTVRP